MAFENDPTRRVNPSRVTSLPAGETPPAPAASQVENPPSAPLPSGGLEGKFAYRPNARFTSLIARADTIPTRYGNNKTLVELAHQAAEAYDGGVTDPRFEEDMGTVLANHGLV